MTNSELREKIISILLNVRCEQSVKYLKGEATDQILALFSPTLSESEIKEILSNYRCGKWDYKDGILMPFDYSLRQALLALSGKIRKSIDECSMEEWDKASKSVRDTEKVTTDTQKYCECEHTFTSGSSTVGEYCSKCGQLILANGKPLPQPEKDCSGIETFKFCAALNDKGKPEKPKIEELPDGFYADPNDTSFNTQKQIIAIMDTIDKILKVIRAFNK